MLALCPVVLAGGAGTRLWPLSREGYPKQLLHLSGNETLLQTTLSRLDGFAERALDAEVQLSEPVIICNEEHRFLVSEQLEAMQSIAGRIALEPVSRNTAPALTVAALMASAGPVDPILLVMPADHLIDDIEHFHRAIGVGVELAAEAAMVTFGIVPARAEVGYGYIRKGAVARNGDDAKAFLIDEFVEKPDDVTTAAYVSSGEYLWNSGIFAVRASVWLRAIAHLQPEIFEACKKAYAAGHLDGAFYWIDRSAFEACPSDSIDYAVMERLNRSAEATVTDGADSLGISAMVVPLSAGWSDIGSWTALHELSELDASGNATLGDVFTLDTQNSLLISKQRFLAAVGIKDTIVVETPDAVLVVDKACSQDVRQVVSWLREAGREEGKIHRRVYRPWGDYEQLDAGERFQVKRLTVKPGAQLSLQMHHHRAEHWVVVKGTAKVTRGDDEFLLSENQSTYIPLGVQHRLENPGSVPLEVIEIQSGIYLGEDDIVRFEDRYNRSVEP